MSAAKKIEIERPSIYNFHDYREFLRRYFGYQRARQPNWSLRSLARQARMAPSYVNMVLSGKRKLSRSHLQKLSSALGLSGSEESFMALLVAFCDEHSMEERESALQQIQSFIQYRKVNAREFEVYHYLSRWYYSAIREMLALPDFELKPEWIQKKLRYAVSLSDIRDAIDFLAKNGFIRVGKDGRVERLDRRLECMGGVYRISLGEYYRQMSSVSVDAFAKVPKDQRNFLSHTVAVPSSQVPKVLEKLNAFLQDIVHTISEIKERDDTVYHFSLQAFPLTHASDKKGRSK